MVALTLMVTVLWAFMHHYQGLARDAELYAVQASAKVHPWLALDVYLANTSQDRYTIFSRIYAVAIESLGLLNAALFLYLGCTVSLFCAAWCLVRALLSRATAWLALIMLASTTGFYGAYQVFHYSEYYLTARSLAEALVVVALAVHAGGRRRSALAIACGALFIHPLMALPGLLLLICLSLSLMQAVLVCAAGVAVTLTVALSAASIAPGSHLLTVLDPPWLEVVRERSQFLFLKYWRWEDWELHARSVLCLVLTALVFDDDRIRKLCVCAVLIGAAGLAVAGIAGTIGPVALLLQGQAWRWFWVTAFMSVLMLAPTAVRAWSDERCGPLCVTLLIAGWTFAAANGTALISLALLLWCMRPRIDLRTGRLLRWAAFALIAIMAVWALANSWSLVTSPRAESSLEPLWLDRVRSIFNLQITAVALFGAGWYWLTRTRSLVLPALLAAGLALSLTMILPETLKTRGTAGSRAEIQEFADWRDAIPPNSTVLVVPATKAASFVWFTLERPNYLSVDQSAGVIFSRETALEIRRRSEVLLPIMEPDWKILTQLTREALLGKDEKKDSEDETQPLTKQRLLQICADPQLGFVIAKEQVGFDPIRHTHRGSFKDWNLYDCRRVRPAAPSA
jgi:hypothetical protein